MSEPVEGFYSHLLFKSSSILDRLDAGLNIPAPKLGAHGPKTQNSDFLENG
jgi:hypothetical protein